MRSQWTYVIILGLSMMNCISVNAQVVDSSFSRLELIRLANNKHKTIEINTRVTVRLLEGEKHYGRLAIVTLDSIGVKSFSNTSPDPRLNSLDTQFFALQDIEFIKAKRGHIIKFLGAATGSAGIFFGIGLTPWLGPGSLLLAGLGYGIFEWSNGKKYILDKNATPVLKSIYRVN